MRGGRGNPRWGGGGANIRYSEQTCQNCQHIRSKLYVAVDRGVNYAFGTQKGCPLAVLEEWSLVRD